MNNARWKRTEKEKDMTKRRDDSAPEPGRWCPVCGVTEDSWPCECDRPKTKWVAVADEVMDSVADAKLLAGPKREHPQVMGVLKGDTVTVTCPFCDETHTHGHTGGPDEHPGFRIAHCDRHDSLGGTHATGQYDIHLPESCELDRRVWRLGVIQKEVLGANRLLNDDGSEDFMCKLRLGKTEMGELRDARAHLRDAASCIGRLIGLLNDRPTSDVRTPGYKS
jgi:hypothetical protein